MSYLFLVGLADVFPSGMFKGAGGQIKSVMSKFFWGLFILIIVGVIIYFVYKSYKNKVTYVTPCSLTVLLENGMERTKHDLKGGIFINKGIKDFKVKLPKKRKAIILGFVPDFAKSYSVDGRLHFITHGDQTIWQQVESKWVLKKEIKDADGKIFEYDLIREPISRETKQIAVNSIKDWKDTIEKNKLTAFTLALGAIIIMIVAHLISLFIQTRIKCGG